MSKDTVPCEKCKARVPHLWLYHHVKKSDGATSEWWICDTCAAKLIKDFASILEFAKKIDSRETHEQE